MTQKNPPPSDESKKNTLKLSPPQSLLVSRTTRSSELLMFMPSR